jgi:DNA-binding MarR family transcriptional regulator
MPVDDRHLDVVVVTLLCGLALNHEVMARLAAHGHGALRFSHGFVVQHLVDGPLPVGELARRMDVSQQAASKVAGELERLGYLERSSDPDDGRVRRVGLSEQGRRAIEATRSARAEVAAALVAELGERRMATLRRTLLEVLDAAGGMDAVRARRVPVAR